MQRRNFIIGAGSLAVGSSAALGTGAFDSAEAERSVSVQTADDASAYLAIEATSQYVDDSGDAIELDFGSQVEDDEGNGLGEHLGEDSEYWFGRDRRDDADGVNYLFKVRNQGTNTVTVTPGAQARYFDNNGDPVDPEEDEGPWELRILLFNEPIGPAELSPGDSVGYGAQIVTKENPPSSIEDGTAFEINANETTSE